MPTPAHPTRIAIVHDRLNVRGGGEMLLEELCRMYPDAPVYTLIYKHDEFRASPIAQHEIRTSFIDKLPLARENHRPYIPFMPLAIERFDLDEFDLVISSSAAFAHGVRTHAKQLHISYIHSPMRYAWHQYSQHTSELGYGSMPIRMLLAGLRSWDRKAAQRANWLLANSRWTAECVRAAFGREAEVIYPPVHVENFAAATRRENFYLCVSRLVPYKRIDLIVEAFNELELPLIIAGEGQELIRLRKLGRSNVRFFVGQSDAQIAELMGKAKAFVYAAQEDFGIAPVEAQAAGCPVIAYASGGLLETVTNETGLFFAEQGVDAIISAVRRFEQNDQFNKDHIRPNAERFRAEVFREQFGKFVEEKWNAFQAKA
jgi:glycosyltransferase involved in cell wall biosynthesis